MDQRLQTARQLHTYTRTHARARARTHTHTHTHTQINPPPPPCHMARSLSLSLCLVLVLSLSFSLSHTHVYQGAFNLEGVHHGLALLCTRRTGVSEIFVHLYNVPFYLSLCVCPSVSVCLNVCVIQHFCRMYLKKEIKIRGTVVVRSLIQFVSSSL